MIFIRDKKGIQILSRNSIKDKPLSSGFDKTKTSATRSNSCPELTKNEIFLKQ